MHEKKELILSVTWATVKMARKMARIHTLSRKKQMGDIGQRILNHRTKYSRSWVTSTSSRPKSTANSAQLMQKSGYRGCSQDGHQLGWAQSAWILRDQISKRPYAQNSEGPLLYRRRNQRSQGSQPSRNLSYSGKPFGLQLNVSC